MTPEAPRRRRLDAERSRTAVLDAAVRLFGHRPDAGMEAVAAAAGVTRQTVYAHFSSRDRLVSAVIDRVTEEALAAMDAADIDTGPAPEALLRLLDAGRRTSEAHPGAVHLAAAQGAPPAEDRTRHEPVAERLERLIRRGQAAGEFAAEPDAAWLVTAVIALAHAAGEDVRSGRRSGDEAAGALRTSVLRVVGADPRAAPS